MNHHQLELVRSSYERVRRVCPLFVELFEGRLALVAPGLARRLPSVPAQRHEAILDWLEFVVAGLDRLDVLLPALAGQAREWRGRGVEEADYDVTGAALLWTIEQVLAGSPGVVRAWRDTYELLAGVMARAATDPHLLPPLRPPRRALRTPAYPWSEGPPSSRRLAPQSARRDTLPTP